MRENELLQHIYERSAGVSSRDGGSSAVVVGPGDDCAVLRLATVDLLVTTDQLIAGRHYDPAAPAELVGHKAMARAISDIAAMAGTPIGAVVAAALPAGFAGADELFDAVHKAAAALACPVVGGDIASLGDAEPSGHGPAAALTVTVLGRAHASRGPVLRSTAAAGEALWVSGELGGAWRVDREAETGEGDGKTGVDACWGAKQYRFVPRVGLGVALADALGERLRSMIDLSDGLGVDAGRVARASGVRMRIDAAALPIAAAAGGDWRRALGDGEDYELAFTAPDDAAARAAIERVAASRGVALTRVGSVLAGEGCAVRTPEGETLDAGELGWEHA